MRCQLNEDPNDKAFLVCDNCGWRVHSQSFYSAENCPRTIPGNEWQDLVTEIEKLAEDWESYRTPEKPPFLTPGSKLGFERAEARIDMLHEAARLLRFVLKKARPA